MAKPIKRGKTWRVEVCAGGVRESKSFQHRATAEQWAADRRRELLALSRGEVVGGKTLAAALTRFRDEVLPGRRGARFEETRITAWLKPANQSPASMPFAGQPLERITPDMLAEWRDARLQNVSSGAVLRDFSLLSAILEHARREWRWLAANPLRDVRKPSQPKARERRVTDAEMAAVRQQLGDDVRRVSGRVFLAARFALATGMRVGEICALKWPDIADKVARVTGETHGAGKTEQAIRDVPLSLAAREVVALLRGVDPVSVFLLNKGSADALWRRATRAAGLDDLHFHDLRHEAVTRIAGANLLDVMSLARMIGHSDPKQLLRYYNPRADDLADRLG